MVIRFVVCLLEIRSKRGGGTSGVFHAFFVLFHTIDGKVVDLFVGGGLSVQDVRNLCQLFAGLAEQSA